MVTVTFTVTLFEMLIVGLGVAPVDDEPEPPALALPPPPLPGVLVPPPDVGDCTNDTVTSRAALTITVHVVEVPEQAPPQLLNTHPDAGDAVNVTTESGRYVPLQVGGQAIPPPLAVTEPVPASDEMETRYALTTLSDSTDAGDVPTALVAMTVQVYDLPVVSSETTNGLDAPDAERVVPPLLEEHVAVYSLTTLPLFEPGVNATEKRLICGTVTLSMAGRSGTAAGVTALEALDDEPAPTTLEARTVNV